MLITQAEFARLAGVSRSAVKQAINNALITAVVEQGGKILINKNEGLQQYQANSRRQRKPQAKAPTPNTPVDVSGLDLLSWGQAPAETPEEPKPASQTPTKTEPAKPSRETLPEYGKSRARSEFEKANLLELQRKTQEGLLLRREDAVQAWNQAVNITRTRLLGVPSTAKQRIPHLEIEEVELLTGLIREALDELAAGEVKA
ncbi:terminase small subunit [Synechococcus phage S-LBS1]|nr:terminase small subunit [Synechococcus phage S-LBS1]